MMKKDVDIGPIMAMMRSAYRLVKIAPFAYSVIYIVGIGIYAFCGEDMSDFIKVMLYVSPVTVIYNLLLSKAFKLCIWHKIECCLPLAVIIALSVDAFFPLEKVATAVIIAILCICIGLSVTNLIFIFHHNPYEHQEDTADNT